MNAPLPENEEERLDALHKAHILDTAPEAAFDDLVRLAAHICGVPIAAVSLVDTERQWFKSIIGLDIAETSRESAFCAHTILEPDFLHVEDATKDPRFADNSLVTGGPHIQFYAGAPLVTPDGFALGSLCVIDRIPRQLTEEQKTALQILARQTVAQIELTRRIAAQDQIHAERLAAERIVRQSERRLSEAQRVARIGSWEYDVATGRFTWSAEMFALLGFDPALDEPDYDVLMTHYHPDDVAMHTALVTQVIEDGLPYELEIRILTGDGAMRWGHCVGEGERGGDGRVVRLFGTVMDITARKQVAEENSRLAAIVESCYDAVLGVTLDGTLVSWNAGAERLYGFAAREIIGSHVSVLAPPEERGLMASVIQSLHQGRPQENVEVRRQRKNGEWMDVSLTFSPIQNQTGEMIGVAAIGRDVTAQRAAEEAVRRSEARLNEAQRIARLGSYEHDIATGRLTFSEEMFRLYGFDPAQGTPGVDEVRARYHPEDLLRRDAVVARSLETGDPFDLDLRIVLPGGEMRWCHAVSRIVRDNSGKPVQIIGTVMDITERMLSEERFRILFEQSSDTHILFDGNGIIDCNNAAVELLNCKNKAEILNLHPAVLSPEFQPDGRRSDEKCREMDAIAHAQGWNRFEWWHRKMDGEIFPVEVTLTPVNLHDKPALLVVWHDLTARKQVEQQIKDYSIVLEFQKAELEKANEELSALATTDGLTGLKNHRTFQEKLLEEISNARRYHTPLSVVLLDVDHFKQFNDTFGHPAGDVVLRQVARTLEQTSRDCDFAARYGGEEFVLILPQTDYEGASCAAERCRAAVESALWSHRPITASFGVATLSFEMTDSAALIAAADRALYAAKAGGRNQVFHAHLQAFLTTSERGSALCVEGSSLLREASSAA